MKRQSQECNICRREIVVFRGFSAVLRANHSSAPVLYTYCRLHSGCPGGYRPSVLGSKYPLLFAYSWVFEDGVMLFALHIIVLRQTTSVSHLSEEISNQSYSSPAGTLQTSHKLTTGESDTFLLIPNADAVLVTVKPL